MFTTLQILERRYDEGEMEVEKGRGEGGEGERDHSYTHRIYNIHFTLLQVSLHGGTSSVHGILCSANRE